MADTKINGLTKSHFSAVSILCSLGLFIAGYIFYSSSLLEPYYTAEFHLHEWQIGFAQAAVPLGSIFGAILAGRLGDFFGRHRMLSWNFLLLCLFGVLNSMVFDFYSLCMVRSLNGFLAGTLYPLCAVYLIEMVPAHMHARQIAILMFINCLAAPFASFIAMVLLFFIDNGPWLWRAIAMVYIVPAGSAFIWLNKIPESSAWLYCIKNSSLKYMKILAGIKMLLSPGYRYISFCLLGTWFLMDIAYYGINFFTPYLLKIIESQTHFLTPHTLIYINHWAPFIVNLFFSLGALFAIWIVEKMSLIQLQKYGFLIAGSSLFLLASYFHAGFFARSIVLILFIAFNFSLNAGPSVTTYLLSAASYPVEVRASAHGFIAGFAKFGSFLGVLLLPKLQQLYGHVMVLLLLAVFLFMAYFLTHYFNKLIIRDESLDTEIRYETN